MRDKTQSNNCRAALVSGLNFIPALVSDSTYLTSFWSLPSRNFNIQQQFIEVIQILAIYTKTKGLSRRWSKTQTYKNTKNSNWIQRVQALPKVPSLFLYHSIVITKLYIKFRRHFHFMKISAEVFAFSLHYYCAFPVSKYRFCQCPFWLTSTWHDSVWSGHRHATFSLLAWYSLSMVGCHSNIA